MGIVNDITEQTQQLTKLIESQRLLDDTSGLANIGHWRLDIAESDLFWSDEVFRIHGYEPGEITPELDMAINAYHPDDRELVANSVSRSQAEGKPYRFNARIVRPSGEVRHVIASGQTRKEGGVDVVMFGVFQDITEQVETQEQSQLWNYLVNETPEAIIITDAQGNTLWVNKAFEKISGYTFEEMEGKKPGSFLQGPETDQATIDKMSQAIQNKQPVSVELLNYSKLGEPYWIMISIFPRFDAKGELKQFMAIETDITARVESEKQLAQKQKDMENLNFQLERQKLAAEELAAKESEARLRLEKEVEKSKKLQKELETLANTDALTEIANRRYFMIRAESEFQRALRYKENLHVVMFDVDKFKSINDTYGHQAGDQVLKTIVTVVKSCLRDKIDFLGRVGGEEFCLLLPHTLPEDAVGIVNRIRQEIESAKQSIDTNVTCSFGVALAVQFDTFNIALSKADEALYDAKHNGRNRVEYWQV
ncbi:diguanylate cyclase [Aliikangiella marina]|uniref:diguanylate cyclase n=1 Tax=Aliikangiella marina TaxID=1712262 RepID=A0A545TBZ0_9GAMM|nr:sensor domain-containing diguanylate cyclase [Aliikangiella marina]TQV74706.1 diguanylate cyclase [Aliikangiella marina]